MIDKKTKDVETIEFSLGWWSSFINYAAWADGVQNSGDYIFRPLTGQYDPYVYTNFKSGTVSTGENGAVMTLYFQKEDSEEDLKAEEQRNVMVQVQIDPELSVLRFDVNLDSLPPLFMDGYELVVKF